MIWTTIDNSLLFFYQIIYAKMHSYWFYFVYSFCYVLEEKKAFSLSLVQISGGAITNKGTVRISADINFK